MKNALITYSSKTGFTRRYAEWLAEELHLPLLPVEQATAETWQANDSIIHGGGVYAGVVRGLERVKRGIADKPGKRLVVFAVGATPATEEYRQTIWKDNFSSEERRSIPLFYLSGGMDFARLTLPDKLLISLFYGLLALKPGKKPNGMPAKRASYDLSDRANLQPLIAYLKKMR